MKMANDAVEDEGEHNDDLEDIDRQENILKLLQNPRALEDINIQKLDQFLRERGSESKILTLADIKNELNNPYRDFREYTVRAGSPARHT